MRHLRALALGVLVTWPCTLAGASEPVAIVYSLAGEASLTAPGTPRRPLRLFDRLPAGTTVEVGTGSRVALAFANGRRYELGERSQVAFGPKDLASRSGSVRDLPRVPPLPRLAPIAAKDRPGARAGAVRIRGEEIDLFPRDGAVTLAEATLLRFQAVSGAARHQVEVEDARGTVVFQVVTDVSPVRVPAGILQHGARYHWTVTALDRPGPVIRGEAGFVTLSREAVRARERLRTAVERMDDDGSRALLDAVDHALGLTEDDPETAGAVIESVKPESPGMKAGLQPGDLILSWFCAASPPAFPQPSGGAIRSPYDLLPLEIEEAPRRAVTLGGRRGNQEMLWTLAAGEWEVKARPSLPAGLGALYLEGTAKIEAGDFAAAEVSWRSAAESARVTGDGRLAAWFLNWLAEELARAGKWPEADAAYEQALAALEETSDHVAAAQLLRRWGGTFDRRGAWDAAVERFQKALALDRKVAPKSLAAGRTLNALGTTTAKRGDYPAAEEILLQGLAIREELAPGTTEVTGSLNNLGILARRRGQLSAAEGYLTRTEEILRRVAPGSTDQALVFQNLGNLAQDRGDLEKAEHFHREALAIFERIAPEESGVSDCFHNLGVVMMLRGDLAVADELFRRALAFYESKAPEGLGASSTLINLGNLAARRGDLEAAEAYYRRALAIQEKLSPESLDAVHSVASLGIVATLRGEFPTARTYLRRVLAIKEKVAPGSLEVAVTFDQLGRLEAESGNLEAAEDLFRKALAIFEEEAPESLETSGVLRDLGEVAARRGRTGEAVALHRRALELQSRLAPETTGEAEALYFLGRAERRAGHSRAGTRDLCRAIDVLDRQRTRLGGPPEVRTSFEAILSDYYLACLEGLIDLGQPAEAFHVLERGRARSFLALLAERDLRLSELPPELAAERRRVNAEYDRVQSRLSRLSASKDAAEIERLTGELRNLRTRQEEILARMRRESPRSAALQDPEPLDLPGVRAALDPGTVFLEYAVGQEKTWLFAVQPADVNGAGLSVFQIDIGAKGLREEVESFRRLLKNPESDREALRDKARRLYDLLVRPAERRIDRAKRILVSPDGPLHTLPFAALRRGNRYLVEHKPVHSVLSATVYAEMTRSRPARRDSGGGRLAAFGDPVYRSPARDAPADPDLREAVRRGLALLPLPSSGREVRSIAELYPRSQIYLGSDATEEKAKSIGREPHLVHFACHGLLDERFPLNSALALTLPEGQSEGRDNGLLQAWEIFESVRLDADLVTLSACDTGLGREMGGEGLVGLTRAFQYAGARSVLASLWSVADVSTARFMTRFYGHLREGRSKDEALRAAQIDQIREKAGAAHPFHWAAFQLYGDWR
ncbi:MAG TPA: CHAT domain-containing protein [Thermoanaerobaculia bacterium]|nr:CHAT domain-containing protein [Thermoanaerobaculia bacterium]